MQAKAIVGLHEWSIEPGEIHENNQRVIDWINHNKEIIKRSENEYDRKNSNT